MPSPLAHAGVALAAWALLQPRDRPMDRRSAAAIAFASFAPDLDLLVGLAFGDPIGWHRGASHSLIGAAVIGAALAPLAKGAWARAGCVVAATLHVPMDWSTGEPGAPVKYGVPALWPFTDQKYIAADPVFGAFHIDEAGFLANLLDPRAVGPWLREIGVALAAGGIGWVWRRWRR